MSTTVRLPGGRPKTPKTTEQEIDILGQKITYLEGILAELHDQVDKDNSALIEKIGICRDGLKDLQSLLYGDPRFLITGLAAEIRAIRVTLDALEEEREAFMNQIKGVKIALYVVGVIAGIPALNAILPLLSGIFR